MRLRILFFTGFLFASLTLSCQEYRIGTSVKFLKRNIVYGTLGIGPIYGTILGNYEHLVSQPLNSFISAVGIRAGGGVWALWEEEGLNYLSSLFVLSGRRASHLETGLGLMVRAFSSKELAQVLPSGNIGYRFQKPEGIFVFRAGIGWPEAGYVSTGFCF